MNFINWHGSQAQLFVTEPELVKDILNNREGAYPKMDMESYAKKLFGESLITNEGEKWAKVRKIANHTFHAESLKSMIPEMSTSVETMLERWKDYNDKEIDVHKEFGVLTTKVISRTAFGSSYIEGKHIFEMVAKLTTITVRNIYKLQFPGISLIMRTDDEVEAEKLEQGIKTLIQDLVKKRKKLITGDKVDEFGTDYSGQLAKIVEDCNDINYLINIPASEVMKFLNGLFESRADLSVFKNHIRDFLVQSKEFSAQVLLRGPMNSREAVKPHNEEKFKKARKRNIIGTK